MVATFVWAVMWDFPNLPLYKTLLIIFIHYLALSTYEQIYHGYAW